MEWKTGLVTKILAFIGLVFISAFFVQWIWNLILPYLCGWRNIDYWRAFGLIVLVRFLVTK